MLNIFLKMLFLIVVIAQVSCSGDSGVSDVKFRVVPNNPIVITGDINIGNKIVKAPWFSFRVQVKNGSKKPVTLVAIQNALSIINDYGAEKTNEATFAPSVLNFSRVITVAGEDVTCNYEFNAFETIAANSTDFVELSVSANEVAGTTGCGAVTISSITFYSDSNPGVADSVSSYNYNVTMKPLGWFGTYADPEDRFEKQEFFSTQ